MREITPKNQMGFSWTQEWLHPPFWWAMNASAGIHDENYTVGGNKSDRLNADVGFFWRIIADANQLDYKQKRKAVRAAIYYYLLVRLFGWLAFKKR